MCMFFSYAYVTRYACVYQDICIYMYVLQRVPHPRGGHFLALQDVQSDENLAMPATTSGAK